MWGHYYTLRTTRRSETAALDAERRAHEAELRAARAEATAEAVRSAPVGGTHYVDANHDGIPDAGVRRRNRWFDW